MFQLIKNSARRRNKPFTITLEWFTNFCQETNYIEKKGKTPGALTIDRKDHKKGYEPGNLRTSSPASSSE